MRNLREITENEKVITSLSLAVHSCLSLARYGANQDHWSAAAGLEISALRKSRSP